MRPSAAQLTEMEARTEPLAISLSAMIATTRDIRIPREETAMHDLVIRGGTVVDGTGARPASPMSRSMADNLGGGRGSRRRPARDRCARTAGHARLRRHPYALRRPGHLGSVHHALVLARRHHRRVRQLRRRLCAGAQRCRALPDQPHGRCRGHSRHGAGRGRQVRLGILPAISSTSWTRCRRSWTSARRCRMRPCAST